MYFGIRVLATLLTAVAQQQEQKKPPPPAHDHAHMEGMKMDSAKTDPAQAHNMNMPGMNMPGMNMVDMNPAAMALMDLASGTAVNPAAWPMPMTMSHVGNWNTMFMATAFVGTIQQSGPRGGDKFYSPNWFMVSAEHRVGSRGAFQADLMLSLEPATITDRRYPLLFQTGETAFGKPLADAQHPHNFIMGLGFHYAYQLSEDTTLEAYFAPVGDPALGPVAYPHRASAMELPEATLAHHLQDSTHISYEVATIGLAHKKFKIEASGFHGQEPGENRWKFDGGALDSWSARLWYFPTKRWAAQFSVGRVTHIEELDPGDQVRTTASLHYSLPMPGGSRSSSLIWGRTHNTTTRRNLNSYLAESVLPIRRDNFVTGRFELVDKDELFSAEPDLETRLERISGSTFRIGAYTIGYTRDLPTPSGGWLRYVQTGVGVNFSAYSLPAAIQPFYGRHPVGGNIFLRFRLRPPA
jgi:hypothetical protein